jgi:hypothetical protein
MEKEDRKSRIVANDYNSSVYHIEPMLDKPLGRTLCGLIVTPQYAVFRFTTKRMCGRCRAVLASKDAAL